MVTVWKYPLTFEDRQVLDLPIGARVLHFGNQREVPCIWVEVVSECWETAQRVFRLAGTEHDLGIEKREYVGSVIFAGGDLVFHLYEV